MEQICICIIGGGLSGTLLAVNLLQAAQEATTVYLLEKEAPHLHRGVAYSSALPFQPLNVPALRMSLYPERPSHFVEWLLERQYLYPALLPRSITPHDFIPRCIFGDYVADVVKEAETNAPPGVQLVRLPQEVTALEAIDRSFPFVVSLRDGSQLRGHKVILALGNLPPINLPIPNQAFYQSSFYYALPWSAQALEGLPSKSTVLLLGSSLTMVDWVGSLVAKGHQGKIYVVSRHGLLPAAHYPEAKPYPVNPFACHHHLSPLQALRLLRNEVRKATAKGYPWQSIIDAIRESVPRIWQNFSYTEKKQFVRHLRPYWEVHRHRMPPASASMLHQLRENGQLQVKAASLVDIQEVAGKAEAVIKERGKGGQQALSVDLVINCTGPLCDYRQSPAPLIRQLIAQGLICPDPLSLGINATTEGNVLNARNLPVENLYTLGPPLKGILYESTALREIWQQAVSLASLLLSGKSMLAAP